MIGCPMQLCRLNLLNFICIAPPPLPVLSIDWKDYRRIVMGNKSSIALRPSTEKKRQINKKMKGPFDYITKT